MKQIEIQSKGETFVAFVDDEDYPVISRFHWNILFVGTQNRPYAFTRLYNEEKKNGKTLLMHSLVMGNTSQHDHKNENSLDNQKHNLRPATTQQNGWNRGKNKSGKHGEPSSQYKGVSYKPLKGKDRWFACFKYVEPGAHKSTGKMIRIGYFDTELEAALAYDKTVIEKRGKWAWTNILNNNDSKVG